MTRDTFSRHLNSHLFPPVRVSDVCLNPVIMLCFFLGVRYHSVFLVYLINTVSVTSHLIPLKPLLEQWSWIYVIYCVLYYIKCLLN